MKLFYTLLEMAAAKQCPNCGHPMANYHYYYKGEWKCKSTSIQNPAPGFTPTGVSPATAGGNNPVAPAPAPTTPKPPVTATPPVTTPPTPSVTPTTPPEPSAATPPVTTQAQQINQPLSVTLDIVDAAKPLLDAEIEKINKTATKIGAKAVTVTVDKTYFKTLTKRPNANSAPVKYQVKMLTVTVTGSTPRVQANDGTYWDFVGVITPSATGKAIIKLTPGTADTTELRKLYDANPYYCDHCRTTRQRNETFIVQNGTKYRQVGRNCLKDFVGAANPQAILTFFAWFSDAEDLENYFAERFSNSDSDFEGGGFRGNVYLEPIEVLTAACGVVKYRGGYVSASSETGTPTSMDVRWILFGSLNSYSSTQEKQDFNAMTALLRDSQCKTDAQAILDWFKAMPQTEKEANTYFKNIDIMVQENTVEKKQVGYIVGLYISHLKALQKQAETTAGAGGVKMIKEWDDAWGSNPIPIKDQHAKVNFVKTVQGAYGSSQIIYIMLDDGKAASWRYSGSYGVEKGDEYTITGSLEKDEYWTPPRIKFVPDRKWLRGSFKTQNQAIADAYNAANNTTS